MNIRLKKHISVNVPKIYDAGADIFVVGTSSVFKSDMTVKEGTDKLFAALNIKK